jgi:hypothetical protein
MENKSDNRSNNDWKKSNSNDNHKGDYKRKDGDSRKRYSSDKNENDSRRRNDDRKGSGERRYPKSDGDNKRRSSENSRDGQRRSYGDNRNASGERSSYPRKSDDNKVSGDKQHRPKRDGDNRDRVRYSKDSSDRGNSRYKREDGDSRKRYSNDRNDNDSRRSNDDRKGSGERRYPKSDGDNKRRFSEGSRDGQRRSYGDNRNASGERGSYPRKRDDDRTSSDRYSGRNKDSNFNKNTRDVRSSRSDLPFEIKPEWVSVLKHNPISKLIYSKKPAIVFEAFRDLFQLDYSDEHYKDSESKVNKQEKINRLLREPNFLPTDQKSSDENDLNQEEGTLFFRQLVRAHHVAQLGGRRFLMPAQDVIVSLLKFQKDSGRFPLFYHHHAHATWLLLRMGMEGNRFVDKAIHWILKRQRDDGGWLHRSMIPEGESYSTAESCLWTTAEVLQLLATRKVNIQSAQIKNMCEFMLDRVLKENTTSFFKSDDNWNRFGISFKGDAMFQGGTLKVLESVISCGYNPSDPRVKKMYQWLLETQMDNGLFPSIQNQNPIADLWVTLRVLKIVKAIETTRPEY